MGCYRVEWKHKASNELRKIAVADIPRIVAAVNSLGTNPFPVGSVKLSGNDGCYWIRVGDYRIIYSVFEEILLVEVVRVGHRREVYRN